MQQLTSLHTIWSVVPHYCLWHFASRPWLRKKEPDKNIAKHSDVLPHQCDRMNMITLQHWMWKRCSILSFIRYGYSQVCITKVLQGCIQFSNSWDQNGMKVRFDFRLCCRHAHNSAWILSASSLKYPRQHRACANWLRPYFDWRSNRLAYTALALSSAISVLVDPKLFTAEALPQRNVGPHRSGGSFWSGCPRASCHEKAAGLQSFFQ